MKKLFTCLAGLPLLLGSLQAQTFLGLRSSPYGGVNNVVYNPAIADNRMEFDLNIIGVGASVQNNYVRANSSKMLLKMWDSTNVYSASELAHGRKKFASMQTQALMPLSFMFNWGGENGAKNGFAFTWHQNAIANLDNVEDKFARAMYGGINAKTDSALGGALFNNPSLDPRFSFKYATWTDFGFTYSRVILDNDKHMVKVGGTLKLVLGQMGGYANITKFNYDFPGVDSMSVDAEMDYYHTPNSPTAASSYYNMDRSEMRPWFNEQLFSMRGLSPGFGADFGFVYEWRPKKNDFQYEMDCKKWWRMDQNRYKLSVGASIIDMGFISFKQNFADYKDVDGNDVANANGRYHVNFQNADVNDFNFGKGIESVTDTLRTLATLDSSGRKNFMMGLPTRFNIFLDYNIWKGFGLNFQATISPGFAPNQVHYTNIIALTPKYDHSWVGVYVPLSYEFTGNFRVGTTLRLGPVIVGTNNLLSLFGKKGTGADVHVGFKIPIPYSRLKDKDKDGVSNKMDLCKKEKGNCKSQGCPDRDNDGIVDTEDACPDEAGLAEFKGCPDRDGDKIIDSEDACPDEFGIAALKGCPDRDGDGIADNDDACPDESGPAEFNGCPDQDGDGVMDKDDICPTIAGPKEMKGCPDTDGDGVIDPEDACPTVPGIPELKGCPQTDADGDGIKDTEDKCPTQAGPIENGGCPYADTDGDGIIDLEDKCPKTPGVKENFGCPEIDEKAKEVLKRAFDNLEFNTGKSTIRSSSYESLDDLATYLKENVIYNLLIEGHTDNVGSRSSNITLSKNRATAVKTYLNRKGVSSGRLITKWYGPDKPVGDNSTNEGRQQNRRVEMNLIVKE